MLGNIMGHIGSCRSVFICLAAALKAAGVISKIKDGVRILADGDIKAKLSLEVAGASKSAVEKLEKAGGKITVLSGEKVAAE